MKSKKKRKSYKTVNRSPGTVYYRGKKQSTVTDIDIINYSKEDYQKIETQNVEDAFHFKGTNQVTWINVNGLNNTTEIEKLGLHYGLHPLTLEDIVNTTHRPKLDEFDNYLFVILKMLYIKEENELVYEQVSMVIGEDYVLTFQEADGDVFDDLRERISSGKGRVRSLGSDYLMYAIMDAVVDHYLTVIEAFGDKIEDIEDRVFESDSDNNQTANTIQGLKREILKIRRSVLPLREVINLLDKLESSLIEEKTHNYLRDLYDHIVQVNESIEVYREMIWSLLDMYMTIISNKMNEVMKVLTIMATIFIPLTFIAGIYGMNFDNMPELHYKYSYHILIGVMILIFFLMIAYFRKKKWL
ncbi:magnesium/cobalt transporter CorA [Gelidibacter japonicus]|jgi:magnesium transporter|uniref:magnesium/cobalt transporter CorA n=1 Tax=Gelidibacter japonicus TaxID=1962232 RepID=UPI0020207A1C|nr:magnesium/cobalt transporter CorA [Gelidibacter japonicus]MCL8006176.1 magnesium/cobalt transporter CorA [Gelidibacter japonicus]